MEGVISEESARSLGWPYFPTAITCGDHSARSPTRSIHILATYPSRIMNGKAMRSVVEKGNIIAQQCGGLYPFHMNAQECEARKRNGRLLFAHHVRVRPPEEYHALVGILNLGVHAIYDRGAGIAPGIRGPPTILLARSILSISPRVSGKRLGRGYCSRDQHHKSKPIPPSRPRKSLRLRRKIPPAR